MNARRRAMEGTGEKRRSQDVCLHGSQKGIDLFERCAAKLETGPRTGPGPQGPVTPQR
jgi:hypothetical protein